MHGVSTVGVAGRWRVTVGVVSQPAPDTELYRCTCLHCAVGLAGRGDGYQCGLDWERSTVAYPHLHNTALWLKSITSILMAVFLVYPITPEVWSKVKCTTPRSQKAHTQNVPCANQDEPNLQTARRPPCYPINSVKALKEIEINEPDQGKSPSGIDLLNHHHTTTVL